MHARRAAAVFIQHLNETTDRPSLSCVCARTLSTPWRVRRTAGRDLAHNAARSRYAVWYWLGQQLHCRRHPLVHARRQSTRTVVTRTTTDSRHSAARAVADVVLPVYCCCTSVQCTDRVCLHCMHACIARCQSVPPTRRQRRRVPHESDAARHHGAGRARPALAHACIYAARARHARGYGSRWHEHEHEQCRCVDECEHRILSPSPIGCCS